MTAAMPYAHLGEALATDYLLVREQFSDEQWEHFIATRRFVDTEVLPASTATGSAPSCPWPLIKRLAELGVVGEDIDGYGCPGMTPLRRAWSTWSCIGATGASGRSWECSPGSR